MVARQIDPVSTGESGPSMDSVPVPVIVVDVADDRILEVNSAAAALISCTPQDIQVLPFSRAVVESDGHAVLKLGDRSVGIRVIGPPDWRTSTGPVSLVLLDRLDLASDAMDDTELKAECDELRRVLHEGWSAQERLISVWAHELKTPLTVIQSYLEILTGDLDEGLSDEQLSFLNITKESVHRLRRLVLDLVDLIGFRSGQLSVETATVDVAELLDEIIDEMLPLAKSADIELVHERPAIRISVRADVGRMGQILRNLIDNAFKFTPADHRVTVRTRVERDWVIIDVVDEGIGIRPSDLDRIFVEFVQLKQRGARRKQRGSGLGLAISQRIAEAHGGAIEVETTLDEGSTFSVRLPREHDEIE